MWKNKEVLFAILLAVLANIFSWVVTDLNDYKWHIVLGTAGFMVGVMGWSARKTPVVLVPALTIVGALIPRGVTTWGDVFEAKGWFLSLAAVGLLGIGSLLGRFWDARAPHALEPENGAETTQMSGPAENVVGKGVINADRELLVRLAADFRGSALDLFIENLEESRSILPDMMDSFQSWIRSYRLNHNRFRNAELEGAKVKLLDALEIFIAFSHENFDGSRGGKVRFTAGLEPNQAATTQYRVFQKKENELIEVSRSVQQAWAGLIDLATELVPDYRWPS